MLNVRFVKVINSQYYIYITKKGYLVFKLYSFRNRAVITNKISNNCILSE